MRYTAVISFFLFVPALADLSAQSILPESTRGSTFSMSSTKSMGIFNYAGLNSSKHKTLSLPPQFTMPETAPLHPSLAGGYYRPVFNDYGTRISVGCGGYMPLVVKGDYRLGLTGSLRSYPSMGFSNSISVGNSWEVSDGITLYGNLYVSDNMHHRARFKDFGVSGRVRVQVADGFFLNGYGNYSIYSSAGGQQLPPFMYPTNSYGGTVEVKITDKFGLEGGVQREFNMFTREWETSYYVLPVFY